MRNFTWNRFPIKNLLIDSLLTPIVESTYLNVVIVSSETSVLSRYEKPILPQLPSRSCLLLQENCNLRWLGSFILGEAVLRRKALSFAQRDRELHFDLLFELKKKSRVEYSGTDITLDIDVYFQKRPNIKHETCFLSFLGLSANDYTNANCASAPRQKSRQWCRLAVHEWPTAHRGRGLLRLALAASHRELIALL